MNDQQYAEIIERLSAIKEQQLSKSTQEMLFLTLEQLAEGLEKIAELLKVIKETKEFYQSETLIS